MALLMIGGTYERFDPTGKGIINMFLFVCMFVLVCLFVCLFYFTHLDIVSYAGLLWRYMDLSTKSSLSKFNLILTCISRDLQIRIIRYLP